MKLPNTLRLSNQFYSHGINLYGLELKKATMSFKEGCSPQFGIGKFFKSKRTNVYMAKSLTQNETMYALPSDDYTKRGDSPVTISYLNSIGCTLRVRIIPFLIIKELEKSLMEPYQSLKIEEVNNKATLLLNDEYWRDRARVYLVGENKVNFSFIDTKKITLKDLIN